MPRLFKLGNYIIYFWSNENQPVEPVHVHISEGHQSANATKIWLTSDGTCKLCHNNSKIPSRHLYNTMQFIEANSKMIIDQWKKYFGEVKFYC